MKSKTQIAYDMTQEIALRLRNQREERKRQERQERIDKEKQINNDDVVIDDPRIKIDDYYYEDFTIDDLPQEEKQYFEDWGLISIY